MNIQLITVWYNEAFLAPFFLKHYAWVDKIHILLDADTDDSTEEVAARYPNVSIERFTFPDMMDDLIKSRKINEKHRSITDADYVIVVDSDEFIACNCLTDSVKNHIITKDKNLYFATLWQVYQHEDDASLDAVRPAICQRQHGDPTIANCNIKPVVARAGLDMVWGVGNHAVVLNGQHMSWLTPNVDVMTEHKVSVMPADMLQGAHWRLFDLDEVITRRTRNRSNRQSLVNLSTNLSSHLHKASAADVIAEFNRMKISPLVLKDRICGTGDQQVHNTIFEALLAEPAYTDGEPSNHYATGVSQMYESCTLPEWHASVQPFTALEALADETFLLACTYNKAGDRSKAITLLKKALALFPASEHYRFYLRQMQNEVEEHEYLPRIDCVTKGFRKGRNVYEGYQRGWGLQFTDLREKILRDPLYCEASKLAEGRTIISEQNRMNLYLIVRFFLPRIDSGHIIEFGSYLGGNAIFMAYVADKILPGTQVYALDSFEGMPETDKNIDAHNKGDFADTSYDDLLEYVEKTGVKNLKICKGYFEHTAEGVLKQIGKVALAHIDCDILSSVRTAYEYVKPYMVHNGYLVFDDATISSCIGATEVVEDLVIRRDNLNSEQIYPHYVFRTSAPENAKSSHQNSVAYCLR